MSIKVVIIGFGYTDDKIPSTLFDLYQIYNKYSRMGYDCEILTDINDFRYNRNVYESISFKKVDREMLSFISNLKKKPPYYTYVFNKKSLSDKINSIPKSDIVIVYYTGHGSSKGVKMSSGENYPFEEFKSLLVEMSNNEIYIIVDCCHASGMKLNYQLEKNNKGRFIYTEDGKNYKQKVIIIASSQQNEKSAAIKHTSLFTKYFIEFLDHYDTRLFTAMTNYIDDNLYSYSSNRQQVNVYCSRIIIPLVDTYMFVPNYICINYQYNFLSYEDISKEQNKKREDIKEIIVEELKEELKEEVDNESTVNEDESE